MIKVDKKFCTGCTACVNICPKEAITLAPDNKGFLYPQIDSEKCIECNLCERACMTKEKEIFEHEMCDYYIAQINNQEELQHCQSGGAAYAFGKVCLEKSGIVYGAQYEGCEVYHRKVVTIADLVKTCGSKYVQSDLQLCFREVRDYLEESIPVLFTGTSCQIAGLYHYLDVLKIDTTSLYTVDIICHGVPSPLVLKDYIKVLEKRNNCIITSMNMRDRRFSPSTKSVFTTSEGKELFDNCYIELFYSNMTLRESCGNCMFAKRSNPADITIGDTYGLSEKYNKLIDSSNPSSIVIVHSIKGKELLDNSSLIKTKIDGSEFYQVNLEHPTKISQRKQDFWNKYNNKGLEYALKYYTSMGGYKAKLRRKIMQRLGKW